MPATHALIPLDERAEWHDRLRNIDHDFGHTWECNAALQRTTDAEVALYSYADEDYRVVAPIIERRFDDYIDIVTPFGFSGFVATRPCERFEREWTKFAHARNYVCGYLTHNPVLANAIVFSDATPYNTVYALDLTPGLDDIFAGLDRNRRRELRAAQAEPAELVTDRSSLIEFLVREHRAFGERMGAAATYYRSEATLRALCELDTMLMFGAASGGRIQAVYTIAHTPHVATSMFHVHHPEAHFTTQLLWQGIQELKRRAVPLLNLGGGVSENDGVARAKQRFGGDPRPLRASRQVYNAEAYQQLCQRTGADASSRYFPAYRAPQPAAESA